MKRSILSGFSGILFGLLGAFSVMPATAATVDWNTSGDKKDLMEAGNTYTKAATRSHLGVTSNTAQTPVVANPWYDISAGYYLPARSLTARVCDPGKYCPGASNVGYSTSVQGMPGMVSAGYYSSGGATSQTPTGVGNGCLSGNSCGSCSAKFSGYNSAAGSTSVTDCYKSIPNAPCSVFFPVTSQDLVTGAVYSNEIGIQVPSVISNIANATTGISCTSHLVDANTEGVCVPSEPDRCFIRGVTCKTNYHLDESGSVLANINTSYYKAKSVNTSSADNFISENSHDATIGSFSVGFTADYQNQPLVVRGIWMNGEVNSGTATHNPNNTSSCACQVQSIGLNGNWSPVLTNWFGVNNEHDCGNSCKSAIEYYFTNNFVASSGVNISFYNYRCLIDNNIVILNSNGATSGKIQNQTPDADGNVFANCPGGYHIGSVSSSNNVARWSGLAGNDTANITKANSVFLGWSADQSCTTKNCVTNNTCTSGDETVYYAAWANAADACVAADASVDNVSYKEVTNNRVLCNARSKAGYYIHSETTGIVGYGVKATKCPDNWTSVAGATEQTDCYRTIILNKNEGTGTHAESVTCYYNTDCDLGTAELTQEGKSFTGGWGATPDCDNTESTLKIASTAETVTYYACKTTNEITIKWVDVAQNPGEDFTREGTSNNYTSTVPYGSDIKTPAAGLGKTGMQFLGWRFVVSQ